MPVTPIFFIVTADAREANRAAFSTDEAHEKAPANAESVVSPAPHISIGGSHFTASVFVTPKPIVTTEPLPPSVQNTSDELLLANVSAAWQKSSYEAFKYPSS